MEAEQTALEIEPPRPATACVILLHGLGADGHDLAPLAGELVSSDDHSIRFVFPHAPYRGVTINSGYRMRAWYDIRGFDLSRREDEEAIRASAAALHGMIEQQIARGVHGRRIVVAGFSQGGAVALYGGLRYSGPLAGMLAMSSYLPLAGEFEQQPPAADPQTPIMMANGSQDTVVPVDLGRMSAEQLQRLGYTVAWKTYAMGHTLCDEELNDITAWLARVLPDT